MKRIAFTALSCFLLLAAGAQDSTVQNTLAADTTAKKKTASKSYFSATVAYLSNAVYNGRKDSTATPYLTPTIGYYDKSGLFVDGSVSYLAKSGESRIDLFQIEAGYDFYAGNFDGEVAASKSFYNSSSTNVSSEITGSLSASGAYDFTYLKSTLEAGINFGTKSDYTMSFGLEHTFYQCNDRLQLTPGFIASGSTENYYGSYYNKRKVGGKKKNAGTVYDVTASVENAAQFKILAYQFSLPIIYTVQQFSFSLTPVYVLPVNPAVVTVQVKPQNGNTVVTKTAAESISNTFYFSFAISYKF